MPGLIIIGLVIIFGGTLAFLGDRVGMKVGKKRLSIFGLRPKYTSMIITVLTGFFIAGLTLVILTLISGYARTAIFELHSIQTKLQNATKKVAGLTGRVNQKQQEYLGLNHQYATVKDELKEVENKLRQTQRELLQKQKTNHDLEAKNRGLATHNQELFADNQELSTDNQKLSADNQGLVVQNENLTKISAFVKQKNEELNRERKRLNQQVQNLQGTLLSAQDRTKVIEEKPLVFYVGEIIAARVVAPGMKADTVRTAVITPLLQQANEIAVKQGARIPGKTDYALRIKPSRLAEVAGQLADLNDKAVLRVVVENNSVNDEPVNVTLEVYPDQMIFKAGEKIVETQLMAKNSESELRDRLLSLMIQGYNKAIIKGIMTDKANLRDLISVSEIARAISVIKKQPDETYQAALVATQDIYRTGRFQIKIEVKRERGTKS
ncbi:MAG: DUF3084 domain-containing protein [Bacillota bacterium]|jgi:uncharacterized protein (DUF3084 family)